MRDKILLDVYCSQIFFFGKFEKKILDVTMRGVGVVGLKGFRIASGRKLVILQINFLNFFQKSFKKNSIKTEKMQS